MIKWIETKLQIRQHTIIDRCLSIAVASWAKERAYIEDSNGEKHVAMYSLL